MTEGAAHRLAAELNPLRIPQRRRSPRLSSPLKGVKMAQTSAVKRSITVRKIVPRKTAVPSEHNKENTPRRPGDAEQQKVSTPDPLPDRRASSRRKAAMPSPILPSTPPASSRPSGPQQPASSRPSGPQQPAAGAEEAAWQQKVRRSYSRLSDRPPGSPDPRDTLFGFEKLLTPEVVRRVKQPRTALELSGSGLNSFTTLLEAEDCGSGLPEPDPNIPGVAVAKERRRRKRRKVQQIDTSELDVLAAKMNAEFEEAEEFELVVE